MGGMEFNMTNEDVEAVMADYFYFNLKEMCFFLTVLFLSAEKRV